MNANGTCEVSRYHQATVGQCRVAVGLTGSGLAQRRVCEETGLSRWQMYRAVKAEAARLKPSLARARARARASYERHLSNLGKRGSGAAA
jgi:hypothetical protein